MDCEALELTNPTCLSNPRAKSAIGDRLSVLILKKMTRDVIQQNEDENQNQWRCGIKKWKLEVVKKVSRKLCSWLRMELGQVRIGTLRVPVRHLQKGNQKRLMQDCRVSKKLEEIVEMVIQQCHLPHYKKNK